MAATAGRSGVVEPAALVTRIEGAVLGYLSALECPLTTTKRNPINL